MNSEEHRRTCNPNADLKVRKGKNLRMQIYCGGSPPFSGQAQGDAAAKVEDGGERCGGGARAAEGLREKEDEERGRTGHAYL